MKNKLLIVIITLGVGAGIGLGFMFSRTHNPSDRAMPASEGILLSTPQPSIAPGIPIAIVIPKINLHASVESVGMDSKGRMDVPKNANDTAWYSPGYKPGMSGSAVIDGHLDRVTGAPAVFWNLKFLSAGDDIIVSENNGLVYTFAVNRIMRYPYDSFPIKEVFGATKSPMLNLITCNGVWDKNSKNYSDRLVVYSKLISQK